ncbi:MAG: adenosine deaminase [Clostridiales bacterium]|nr:adenosine deaminase [Clostridiales bacterium]
MEKEWIRELPKAELHCHLDGSLSIETIKVLADLSEIVLPKTNEEIRRSMQAELSCSSLMEYLEKFQLPLACLQKEEALQYAAYALIKDAAAEGVIYMEVRFAPLSSTKEGLLVEDAIAAVLRGLIEGEREFGVKSGLILCGMRHETVEVNCQMLKNAAPFIGKGVCGIDLAGDEVHYPPLLQKEFILEGIRQGMGVTIHAGECQNAENVRDAILLGATRIGHGLAIRNDREIGRIVKKQEVTLELCPSSNLQTKAVENMEAYPLRRFLDEGIRVTLNTDNRMVTGTTLCTEYEKMKDYFALSKEDLLMITRHAMEAAFLPVDEKQSLLRQIDRFSSAKIEE